MIDAEAIARLQEKFRDVINYSFEDPLEPVDPLTYCSPEGDSCLHMAALRGDEEAINLLLDAGLDIDSQGDMGCTPLHYALSQKCYDAAQLLVERGAAQNIKDEFGREARTMWPNQDIDSGI